MPDWCCSTGHVEQGDCGVEGVAAVFEDPHGGACFERMLRGDGSAGAHDDGAPEGRSAVVFCAAAAIAKASISQAKRVDPMGWAMPT